MLQTSSLSKSEISALQEVAERVMRQSLQALMFEGILEAQQADGEWMLLGRKEDGSPVRYTFEASVKESFGRVRLVPHSIRREGETGFSLYPFLEEVLQNRLDGAQLNAFLHELTETLVKDSQSRAAQPEQIPHSERHYEALESYMADGHPYHPSYKSRLGFSLADNEAYGPEFNREVELTWVAVNQSLIDVSLSPGLSLEGLYSQHLSREDMRRFHQTLSERGDADKTYVYVPVHPWQLENKLPNVFAEQLENGDIVPLGAAEGKYRAQQSIRTLASRANTEAPYIKLALSITNTSTSRILAHHTTQNAPLVSEWLERIVSSDAVLQGAGFRLLKEEAGVSFRYDSLPGLQYRTAYGTLGAIFRQNVSQYLQPSEEAWPLNALLLRQRNGEPFLQEAIQRHGVSKWSRELIRTVVVPIVHLLYGHGIALESHAQNIILVVEDLLPKRIILKDLHDGVRYVPSKLLHPEWQPQLHPEPETHRKFNRYSFLQTESVNDVRDYTFDAFFFICMTDICWALEDFGLSEGEFWKTCTEVILDYQRQHPEYAERYEMFDLFADDALIEEMTKRRIYGDGELYFRSALNPLRLAREAIQG
ncbi:IucA/IucC family protein [Paenibacillus herberti]|uniref:IucA/IucC family siderophore biosynthesis protein n=1 Tax=Paenibacillus herberti TaxID=1619309 RepID=A0A229P0G5_9BACL|nr:IucA/IucC family protein [Paenibacillus herberti]OXM15587.1 IucA/IucC family siderophore biosynthesis protein [Paenibacillus herberti]